MSGEMVNPRRNSVIDLVTKPWRFLMLYHAYSLDLTAGSHADPQSDVTIVAIWGCGAVHTTYLLIPRLDDPGLIILEIECNVVGIPDLPLLLFAVLTQVVGDRLRGQPINQRQRDARNECETHHGQDRLLHVVATGLCRFVTQ